MNPPQPHNPESPVSKPGSDHKLPRSIWILGFVSMFMDISSELVHSLLPVFMATVLGASMVTIGFVEGIAEAAASITKVFSGVVSDNFRKRKLLAVLGYGLAALTKPIFPLAPKASERHCRSLYSDRTQSPFFLNRRPGANDDR